MSAGAEATAGGFRPTPEQLEAAVSDAMAATEYTSDPFVADTPSRAPSAEVPLRTLEVYLPEENLIINGKPFSVSIDEKALAKAVNVVAEGCEGRRYPFQLSVELGNSLLESMREDDSTKKMLQRFKGSRGTAINITVPRAQTEPTLETDEIAALIARRANDDLYTALNQNIKARESVAHVGARFTSIAAGAMIGEGLGASFASDGLVSIAERGAIGALLGGGAVMGAIILKHELRGGWDAAWTRSVKRASKKVKKPTYYKFFEKMRDENRIIHLNHSEPEVSVD